MHRGTRNLVLSLILVATGACASAGTQSSSGSSDKLSKAQILESQTSSAYDAVSRLRPNWLRPAGMTISGMNSGGAPSVLVYVDGQRMGGVDVLRTITTAQVMSMEFLSPTRAATVLSDMSSNATSAVIVVNTK